MPAADRKRTAAFCTRVQVEDSAGQPETGRYVVVHAANAGEDGTIREAERVNRGFTEESSDNRPAQAAIVADDVRDAITTMAAACSQVAKRRNPTTFPV